MVKISRSKMRGVKLDDDCTTAKICTNEFGLNDNRCFCYGLIDCSTESYLEKCINCNAFVDNAKPLKVYPANGFKKYYRNEKELFMEREYGNFEQNIKKALGDLNE